MVTVGLLTVELALGEGNSLKEKRHIIRSMLDSIRHKFNVSAAEVGRMDSLRLCVLAFSVTANEKGFANAVLDNVLRVVESEPRVMVVEHTLEFF